VNDKGLYTRYFKAQFC